MTSGPSMRPAAGSAPTRRSAGSSGVAAGDPSRSARCCSSRSRWPARWPCRRPASSTPPSGPRSSGWATTAISNRSRPTIPVRSSGPGRPRAGGRSGSTRVTARCPSPAGSTSTSGPRPRRSPPTGRPGASPPPSAAACWSTWAVTWPWPGPCPAGGWAIGIASECTAPPEAVDQVVAISAGGLATSGTTARSWVRDGRTVHHIVDPWTGEPAPAVWSSVSVMAPSCVEANAWSTAAVVWGEDAIGNLSSIGIPARLVGARRRRRPARRLAAGRRRW